VGLSSETPLVIRPVRYASIALRMARLRCQFLGVLLDNAQYLVPIPPPTQKDLEKQFNLVVEDALSHGLTSIHDAGFDPKSLEFYKG
jgi:predicted amidohydrolase YtcJ